MKADTLRKSILQMAIEGKLVPQNPADEPASVLLEKIRAEKQKLIKEGKIKKDKYDSVIFRGADNSHYEKLGNETKNIDDELPFDIPDSWEWVRQETLCWLDNGEFVSNVSLPYLEAKCLRGTKEATIVTAGTVVEVGTKVILVDGENSGEIFDVKTKGIMGSTFKIFSCVSSIEQEYLLLLFALYRELYRNTKVGAAIPHLNKRLFKETLVPLPSLIEQQRIIVRLRELEPLLAKYAQYEQAETELNNTLPDRLRKSILQYAIEGKLVPQDPADEPAEKLLERIRAEKEILVKAGKIKRDKTDSFIYKTADNSYYQNNECIDDQLPFDIPDSWAWCRLGDICTHNAGKTLDKGRNTNGTLRKYITTSNLYWGRFDLKEVREMRCKDNELEKGTAVKGDLLICEGGDAGRTAIWGYDYPICFQNHIHRIRLKGEIDVNYIFNYMRYFAGSGEIEEHKKGIGIQGLSGTSLGKILVALPPINEQRRIATVLNQYEAVIKSLR
jgi:type I restriction enzyme S subunit